MIELLNKAIDKTKEIMSNPFIMSKFWLASTIMFMLVSAGTYLLGMPGSAGHAIVGMTISAVGYVFNRQLGLKLIKEASSSTSTSTTST